MASRKLLAPRTAVYQDGRGNEPMMDVGSIFPAEALNISPGLFIRSAVRRMNAVTSVPAPHLELRTVRLDAEKF
jgi:hypothetical protein